MNKFREQINTNSSISSFLEIGLINSQFEDLSLVQENINEENQFDTYYKNIDKTYSNRVLTSSDQKD